MNMSRKTLALANKEVETFLCILGEEDVRSTFRIVFIEQATLSRCYDVTMIT